MTAAAFRFVLFLCIYSLFFFAQVLGVRCNLESGYLNDLNCERIYASCVGQLLEQGVCVCGGRGGVLTCPAPAINEFGLFIKLLCSRTTNSMHCVHFFI